MSDQGIGASLTISDNIFDKLDEAEAKVKKLSKTTEDAANTINASFKSMANGVNPFISQLKQLNTLMNNIDFSNLGKSGNSSSLDSFNKSLGNSKESAEKLADSIAKVVRSLSTMNKNLNPVSELDKKMKDLDRGFNAISRTAWSMESKVVNSIKSISNNLKSLISRINDSNNNISNLGNIDFGKSIKTNGLKELSKDLRYLREEASKTHSVFVEINKEISKIGSAKFIREKRNEYKDELNNYKKKLNYEVQIAKIKDQIEKKQLALAKLEQASTRRSKSIYLGSIDEVMGMNENTIDQKIAKIKQLKMARASLSKEDENYKSKLDQLNSSIKRLNKENSDAIAGSKELRIQQHSLLNTSDQLMRKLALVFSVSQITSYVSRMVEVRGEFEKQNTALASILQNKAEADLLFDKITKLAVQSPFQLKELVTYTKQLAAYRVETGKLYDTTKMLADVSAGLGVDMNRLILAYGQVKAANYLRGTELRQFSEAGINILGELSAHFSELEGRAISVGDVFQRVSNRMVSFQDVEIVFKRLTEQGGIFYNMQEVQAKTISGMISNLRDSFDVMYNEIGKANEGAIKKFITSIKEMVDNWRDFAAIISAMEVPLIAIGTAMLSAKVANSSFAKSILSIAMSSEPTSKGLIKIENGINKIGKTLKVNTAAVTAFKSILGGLATLGVGAAIGLITTGLTKLYLEMTRSNREAKELQKNLSGIYSSDLRDFKQSVEAFEKLNIQIKESNMYSQERRDLISKLNSQYGEYLGFVATESTSYEQIASSVDKVTEALKRKAQMATYEKSINAIFEQSIEVINDGEKRIKDFLGQGFKLGGIDYKATESEISNIIALYKKGIEKGTLDASATVRNNLIKIMKEYYGKDVLAPHLTNTKKLTLMQDALFESTQKILDVEKQISDLYKSRVSSQAHKQALDNLKFEYDANLENLRKTSNIASVEYKKAVIELNKEFESEKLKLQVEFEGLDKGVYEKRLEELNQINTTIADVNKKMQDWIENQHKLSRFQGQMFDMTIGDANGKSIKEFIDETIQGYQLQVERIEELNRLKKAGTVIDENDLANAKVMLEFYKQRAIYLGVEDKLKKDQQKSDRSTSIEKERIDLLKKVNSEYEKLLANYDKETAKIKIKESYKDAFKEVGLGDMLSNMNFDKAGVVEALGSLGEKAGDKFKKEYYKAIAGLKTEMGVEVQIEGREKLSKEVESMFGGYELSIELDKLEVPQSISQEIAKQFGFEYITLDKLEKEIANLKNRALSMGISLGDETIKIYDNALKKISDIQAKKAKEGVDDYIKYLKKSVSERVKIEIEAQKKIANIPIQFGESQRAAIERNIMKEKQDALDKLSWEYFKGSDIYIRLFEDLEFASTKSLEKMRDKLYSIRESLKNLSPDQLKEIINQTQKIDEILVGRDPFSRMIPNIKEYINFIKERNDIESKWEASSTRESQIKNQLEDQELLVAKLRQELATQEKIHGVGSDQAREVASKLEVEESILDTILQQLVAQGKMTQEYADMLRKGDALSKGLSEAFGKTSSYLNDFSNGISNMADNLESIFGSFSDGMRDALSSVSDIASGLGGLASGAGRIIASGGTDIGGWIQAAGSLIATIGSLFSIGDKKKERQIKREIEYVEKLEKAYRKLESAINDAYSIDTLTNATDDAIKNIQEQIKSYQAMIKVENDKKKTDKNKIKDWEGKIEELIDLEQQLQQDLIANLGGFGSESAFKDAATSFVNAWADAFKETGDGLSGLQEQFDEWIQNAVRQQILLKLSNQYIKPILDSMDKMFAEGSVGGADITKEELDALKEIMEKNAIAFDEAAKKYLEQLGLLGSFGGGSSKLSGLQKGIQSITEETASALEALLNSMRFFVSDSNTCLRNIYTILSSNDSSVNPILGELRLQTKILNSIDRRIASVIKSGFHSGGDGIKVIM